MSPGVVWWGWVVATAGSAPFVYAVAPSPEAARIEAIERARQDYTTPEDVGFSLDEVLAEVERGALVCITAPCVEVAELCAEKLLVV